MKRLFKIEMERAFVSREFFLVLLLEIIIVVLGFLENGVQIVTKDIPFLMQHAYTGKVDILPGVFDAWIGINNCKHRTILYTALPLLSSFAYGSSLYYDETSHYVNNILTRVDRKDYYVTKLVVMFISGGTCAIIPFAIDLLLNSLILPYQPVFTCLSNFMMGGNFLFGDLFYEHPWAYVILFFIYTFVIYGMLTCVCYISTYFFENKYIVISVPFIISYFSLLMKNIFRNITALWVYSKFMNVLNPDVIHIILQMLFLSSLLCVTCLTRISKKRDVL